MTTLLTIAEKQAQAAAIAAQLAEYQANGGRVLTVTKDTVITPQPKSDWITPTTAKPLQVIAPKTAPKHKQPKPAAQKRIRKWIPLPKTDSPNAQIGKKRRADILHYMRSVGAPVTREMIATHLGLHIHGGFTDQMRQLVKSEQIHISHAFGKIHFYQVTK